MSEVLTQWEVYHEARNNLRLIRSAGGRMPRKED